MKIRLFSYIDEAIEVKHRLRFEIQEAQAAIDHFFQKAYGDKEYFVTYISRIKSDDSLKEKIIRQNLSHVVSTPEDLFGHISDTIGCRIECRFVRDEVDAFRDLFRLFPKKRSDGFFQSDRDPRIELRLDESQPKEQKNGVFCYRIDGHFLGDHVLNFELQIKSIINVFWSEIDHKILYKNYNYVLTEQFVHDIMGSIMGDLNIIDRQMEMLYDHLKKLDNPSASRPLDQLKMLVGRTIQDVYLLPLKEQFHVLFDFRPAMDLLTEFLFARVEYESREGYVTEFLRLLDQTFTGKEVLALFGDRIAFDPPIAYNDAMTEELGRQLEEVVNEDILWNLLVHILFDLNPHLKTQEVYRTFVDYLYFCIIHAVRQAAQEEGLDLKLWDGAISQATGQILREYMQKPNPMYFTKLACEKLSRNVRLEIRNRGPEEWSRRYAALEEEVDADHH